MGIDPEILRKAIIDKYGSQSEFANKMGLSDSQVSRGVKNQSVKFMSLAKKAGINIDMLTNEDENKKFGKAGQRAKASEKRIKELEELVESQKDLLKAYQIFIDNQLKKSN